MDIFAHAAIWVDRATNVYSAKSLPCCVYERVSMHGVMPSCWVWSMRQVSTSHAARRPVMKIVSAWMYIYIYVYHPHAHRDIDSYSCSYSEKLDTAGDSPKQTASINDVRGRPLLNSLLPPSEPSSNQL